MALKSLLAALPTVHAVFRSDSRLLYTNASSLFDDVNGWSNSNRYGSRRRVEPAAPEFPDSSRPRSPQFYSSALRDLDGVVENVSGCFRRNAFHRAPDDPSLPMDRFPDQSDIMKIGPSMKSPFDASSPNEENHHGWEWGLTKEGLYLQFPMPGFGKENVKVTVVDNTLIIKGEREKKEASLFKYDASESEYTAKVDLPEKYLKFDRIKAEMEDGMLGVLVPMVKEEERTDVFNVKID